MRSRPARWLRRILIAVAALPVLAILALTGFWFAATLRIESGVRQWIAQERAAGWTVSAGAPERSGWPLSAEVRYGAVAVSGAGPDLPLPVTWRADQVRIGVALLHPRLLTIAGEGAERLRLGSGPELPFTGDVVAIAVPIAGQGPSSFRAVNLRVGEPGGGGPDSGLTVSSLLAHGGAAPDGLRFDFDAVTIGLPPAYPWLFGPRLASLSASGVLRGALPGPETAPVRAAAAWRDAGGTLDLPRVALDWGPLRGEASGSFGLDGDLQPAGNASFRVEDYPKVLQALAQAGRITRQAALAATAVIGLIGHASDQEGHQSVQLPLSLHDRTLALGRIPLARMPELVWPSP